MFGIYEQSKLPLFQNEDRNIQPLQQELQCYHISYTCTCIYYLAIHGTVCIMYHVIVHCTSFVSGNYYNNEQVTYDIGYPAQGIINVIIGPIDPKKSNF